MSLKNRFLKAGLFTLPILAVGSPAGEPFNTIARTNRRKQHRASRILGNLFGKSGLHSDGQLGLTH